MARPPITTLSAFASLATCGILALGPSGRAESPTPAASPPEPPKIPAAQALQKADTDGDGRLSPTERAAARDKARKKLLDRFDQDGDGALNADEKRAVEAEREAKLLERFDADGDGKLSAAERAAARRPAEKNPDPQVKRPTRPGGDSPASGQVRRALVKRFDTDGDGKLSESERSTARAARQKRADGRKK